MTMNNYVGWLNLDFDPFAPGSKSRDFYYSAHRQQILDQVVELSLYSNAMIAVTGPLGAGKTTLASNFRSRFAEEAVCVKISATLFMNQNQFLESLQQALGFKPVDNADIQAMVQRISQYAAELDLEARSLILIVDDAHELSAEVLHLLTQLLEGCADSSIHALLLGENQLDNLLQHALSAEAQERLAVFPLYGFATEETHEYVRFKLATAKFSKEVPVGAGVVGAIHNSSQGMPGAINKLMAEALNSVAPVNHSDDDNIGSLFSGDRIGQYDDLDETDLGHNAREYEAKDVATTAIWIGNIQPGYWASAAILLVLLVGTLLFWDTAPGQVESAPIAVAVTPTSSDGADVSPETARLGEQEEPSRSGTNADSESTDSVANTASDADGIRQSVDVPPAIVSANAEPKVEPMIEPIVKSIVEPRVETTPAARSELAAITSPFVERLLQAAPENYAVQLLASHSEESVSKFVAQLGEAHSAGYFETRYQGKPWFVAVLGTFDDRARANEAISALPVTVRSNEPWIRSVAGIQADIRGLLGSKLLTSK